MCYHPIVAIGYLHTAAIDKNGRAWCWGSNSSQQLGDNTFVSKRTPVSVLGAVKTFCEIAAGGDTTLAIDRYGRIWAWGSPTNGLLGNNQAITPRGTPISILGANKTFCKINFNGGAVYGIEYNGRVWAWGPNQSGQLGIPYWVNTPIRVCVL